MTQTWWCRQWSARRNSSAAWAEMAKSAEKQSGTGVRDQSHAGRSRGARWLSMAASTSLEKSGSMVAGESSGSRAMHSEMVRRSGSAACRTATGRVSSSMTISASARTRARSVATLVAAASASEIRITRLTITQVYTRRPRASFRITEPRVPCLKTD